MSDGYAPWSGTLHWQPGKARPTNIDCFPRRAYPEGEAVADE